MPLLSSACACRKRGASFRHNMTAGAQFRASKTEGRAPCDSTSAILALTVHLDSFLQQHLRQPHYRIMPPAGSTFDMQPALQCLHQYGLALLPTSFLPAAALDAMRCEAAALLEQAEAQQCCSGMEPEDTQQLAEQR